MIFTAFPRIIHPVWLNHQDLTLRLLRFGGVREFISPVSWRAIILMLVGIKSRRFRRVYHLASDVMPRTLSVAIVRGVLGIGFIFDCSSAH